MSFAYPLALVSSMLICGMSLCAQIRSSASYTVTLEATGISGGAVSATGIVSNTALDGGLLLTGAGVGAAKTGFTGQLYDLAGLEIGTGEESLVENQAYQLLVMGVAGDDSLLEIAPGMVGWNINFGPIVSVSGSGLASLGSVYADTAASIGGTYAGAAGQFDFTVLDLSEDNFGDYGGDGLPDAWQVLYFGQPPNADGAPGANPDGDPHDNAFEFLTGFNPLDSADFFRFSITGTVGSTASFLVNKVIPGRTYRLLKGTGLDAYPVTSATLNPSLPELDVTVEDTAFSDPKSFYIMEVTRP